MKEKYIDEGYGFWFVFGETPEAIDITSSDNFGMDVGPIRRDIGERLISEHNRVQSRLVATALAFSKANPEEFKKFWYDK